MRSRGAGLVGGEALAARLGTALGLEESRLVNEGEGGPSLLLGTSISPRLNLGYSIGLFGGASVLRIGYSIGRGWLLQADSGAGPVLISRTSSSDDPGRAEPTLPGADRSLRPPLKSRPGMGPGAGKMSSEARREVEGHVSSLLGELEPVDPRDLVQREPDQVGPESGSAGPSGSRRPSPLRFRQRQRPSVGSAGGSGPLSRSRRCRSARWRVPGNRSSDTGLCCGRSTAPRPPAGQASAPECSPVRYEKAFRPAHPRLLDPAVSSSRLICHRRTTAS